MESSHALATLCGEPRDSGMKAQPLWRISGYILSLGSVPPSQTIGFGDGWYGAQVDVKTLEDSLRFQPRLRFRELLLSPPCGL